MNDLICCLHSLRGVIHVGAHYGEEADDYLARNLQHVCWIEPLPAAFLRLAGNGAASFLFFNCALGAQTGRRKFYVAANEGQSSSLLAPKLHLTEHPEVTFGEPIEVDVRRLMDLPLNFSLFNLLVMDVQGGELDVLRGGSEVIHNFDFIITEVQNVELYEGCALFPDLTEWLGGHGFSCVRVCWRTDTWGDALFVHNRALHNYVNPQPSP